MNNAPAQGGWGSGEVTAEVQLGDAHSFFEGYFTAPPYYEDFHLLVPIQFGIPVGLWMNAAASSIATSLTLGEYGEASLGLLGLQVFDASMRPVSGYGYSTESGRQYNFEGGWYDAVPEPSSRVLFATATVLAVVFRCLMRKLARSG